MSVRVKHQLKDGRIIEIEGEPREVAHTVHELDKSHKARSDVGIDVDHREPAPAPSMQTQIESRPRVGKKDVIDYILTLREPDLKHSMKELMMHFFGRILVSSGPDYQNFYNMTVRAHDRISREKAGQWISGWKLDKDGRYTEYRFVQN
jgi:hypothetical protein